MAGEVRSRHRQTAVDRAADLRAQTAIPSDGCCPAVVGRGAPNRARSLMHASIRLQMLSRARFGKRGLHGPADLQANGERWGASTFGYLEFRRARPYRSSRRDTLQSVVAIDAPSVAAAILGPRPVSAGKPRPARGPARRRWFSSRLSTIAESDVESDRRAARPAWTAPPPLPSCSSRRGSIPFPICARRSNRGESPFCSSRVDATHRRAVMAPARRGVRAEVLEIRRQDIRTSTPSRAENEARVLAFFGRSLPRRCNGLAAVVSAVPPVSSIIGMEVTR